MLDHLEGHSRQTHDLLPQAAQGVLGQEGGERRCHWVVQFSPVITGFSLQNAQQNQGYKLVTK